MVIDEVAHLPDHAQAKPLHPVGLFVAEAFALERAAEAFLLPFHFASGLGPGAEQLIEVGRLDALIRDRLGTHAQEGRDRVRSEEHTSELQSLMRISYAVFCLKKNTQHTTTQYNN